VVTYALAGSEGCGPNNPNGVCKGWNIGGKREGKLEEDVGCWGPASDSFRVMTADWGENLGGGFGGVWTEDDGCEETGPLL